MEVTGHIELAAKPPEPPPARLRQVSIRDVARAASVSHQTVSRVINDHPSVSPATREQVLRSIQDLGFRPNRAARALAGGQVRSLMVLTSNTTLYGYAATLKGIEEEARGNGLAVGITVLEPSSPADIRGVVDRVVEPDVAVLVIAYDLPGELALQSIPPGVPYAAAVESRSERPAPHRPWVWLDDRDAARRAVKYLLDLGHRTVHFIELPSSTGNSQRTAGWRDALEQAGVVAPEPIRGGWDCASGYRAGRMLADDPEVTAVLCGNDDLALGVLSAMREAGRSVPDSVSVVGFDDMPQSAFLSPALTTAQLDFVGLGRDCVTLLLGILDPALAGTPLVARRCELIVRQSSGPPGRAARASPPA